MNKEIQERYVKCRADVLAPFHRSNARDRLRVPTVNADELAAIWLHFGKRGFVHESQLNTLAKIKDRILSNIVLLRVTTDLSRVKMLNGYELLEKLQSGEEYFPNDKLPRLHRFLTDTSGESLHSDYGLPLLERLYTPLLNAQAPDDIIYAIDRILNVIHFSNDLAAFFIQGGTRTLTRIAEQGGYTSGEKIQAMELFGAKLFKV